MKSVTFAYLGPDEGAARLGKKGTSTDVSLFNGKRGDAHLNLVTPARFPEKLPSLLYALDMADEIILPVSQLDRSLGELVLGAELLGKTKGYLLVQPPAQPDQVDQILAKTALKGLRHFREAEGVLREALYDSAAEGPPGNLVLPIDHVFPVKGVGTVVLGLVRSGRVEHHQTVRLYPEEKQVEIRSIQVHDVDHKEASARSRVGCSLKGVEADEVSRGQILAPQGSLSVIRKDQPMTLRLAYTPFTKWEPRPGAVFHLFHALQFVPWRVDTVKDASKDGAAIVAHAEAALTLVPAAPMVAVDLDNKSQRFIGRAKIAG